MFNAARIRDDFNHAAAQYDAHASLQQHVLRQLVAKLGATPKQALILDAGCGTGALSRTLKRHTIIALDNAYRMCVQAGSSGARTVNADMGTLPFADHSFDVVLSSLALQWSYDWHATVTEWLRVLKPSGTLAFSVFGAGTLCELAESFRVIDTHPHVSHFIDAEDIARTLAARVEREAITEYYPDMLTLARHLKALGARNKHRNQRPALMTPRQFKQVEHYYAKTYATGRGLKVSWNVLYIVMQKP
jgi:malonyl-CoA O-methyltransferase